MSLLCAASASRCLRPPSALNDATKTTRVPDVTGMPACVTWPPKSMAVPAAGRNTTEGKSTRGARLSLQ